jgi:hypothetical protein
VGHTSAAPPGDDPGRRRRAARRSALANRRRWKSDARIFRDGAGDDIERLAHVAREVTAGPEAPRAA